MSDKFKYKVVDGKHTTDEGVFRRGDVIELTEEEAAKFANKFARVEVPAPAVEKTAATTAPAKPATTADK